jgi:hypothetical protein
MIQAVCHLPVADVAGVRPPATADAPAAAASNTGIVGQDA